MYGNMVEYLNPALFATMANKEDHPTYTKELYSLDFCDFISTMKTNILTKIELNVFDIL